jgi:pimeloyl-ACP methyl ester carboxylesterase
MKLNFKQQGSGKPFIILHGLFGNLDNWSSHAKKIAGYYQVFSLDLRNHGHSPWSNEFSYEIMADDVLAFIQEQQLKDCILLGHSMGGKTAMYFAQKHPELLDKLIVVDMGVKSYPMHHQTILAGLNAIDLNHVSDRREAQNILNHFVHDLSVQQFLLKNLYWKEKGQLAWRMNLAILEKKMPEILAKLPEIECFTPTLFIKGELSNYLLPEDDTQLGNYFPDFDIVEIKNVGHWVHAEAPDAFLNAVLSFCLR